MRILFAFLLIGSLAGCQATTFETAPLAAEACDAQLAGRWLSIGEQPSDDGEVELRIDADCRIEVLEHEQSGLRTGVGTTVQVGQQEGQRYAWVPASWLRERFDKDFLTPDGDVFVLRYRVDHDQLHLNFPDEKALAHRIIDGALQGEVRAVDRRLLVRLTGPAQPALLGSPRFFVWESQQFRRVESLP